MTSEFCACVATVCGLLALTPVSAHADVAAFSFTSATFVTSDPGTSELGYDFTTGSTPVSVVALGYINDGSNTTHKIGLFDVATQRAVPGALTTVTTSGGGSTSTSFTYATLASPVQLAANTEYQIVSQFFTNEHYFVDAAGLQSHAGLTIGDAVYGYYGSPPTNPAFATGVASGNDPGDFGPNLLANAVPEPTSMALLACGLVVLGLTCWCRHRKRFTVSSMIFTPRPLYGVTLRIKILLCR
jgi:hypothetical protein